MAEELIISQSADKKERYEALLPQVTGLLAGESDLTANLANLAAILRFGMGFFWVGFYVVKGGELVLGPFQGPIACTRIAKGKGVCGSAWAEGKTLIVPDVDAFPGHIACSSDSRSEIVVPGYYNHEVALILDVDSDQLNAFDETDQHYLEAMIRIVEQHSDFSTLH